MGINRGTVLDLINGVHEAGGFSDYNSYSYLFDQVDTMPESMENPEPHWIPVTERLPETTGEYLVTKREMYTHRLIVDIAVYFVNDGWHKADPVIAWMQLPEPYRGVKE